MTRGIAGYGRYDSDPAHVGCPWALSARRSSESPCIARDGRTAMLGGRCVGCGMRLWVLIQDLADDYEPADDAEMPGDVEEAAERFRDLVYEATAPLTGGSREGKG